MVGYHFVLATLMRYLLAAKTKKLADFRCPSCKGRLVKSLPDEIMTCRKCGETFHTCFSVPILVSNTAVVNGRELPSSDFARQVAAVRSATSPATLDALRRAFALEFNFSHPVMQSESGQFLDRLRSSGGTIDEPYPTAKSDAPSQPYVNVIDKINLQAEPLCPPLPIVTGTLSAFNLRMFNAGEATLSSKADTQYRLACKISPIDGDIADEGERTNLLIDLPPGRGITQPVRFRTPNVPGRYRLGVYALIEDIVWLDEICALEIDVVDEADLQEEFAWNLTDISRDYGADHSYALDLTRDWMGPPGWRKRRVLEIGGNMDPMVNELGIKAYNLDVDPYGLMAGSIFAGPDHPVTNIVGDGMNLPFPDGFFDAIMMFATFHHFPDPVALLRHLKTKLAANGQIFLMCEPIGHAFAESGYDGYVRELEHGAYEQAFMPWEYEAMIRDAGLVVAHNVMDVGSAKIALRHPPDNRLSARVKRWLTGRV